MSIDKTNLVFEGGGVKGIAYAGAIKALENAGVLTSIERVAGTSAGSITAALLSLRYSADEIKTIISGTDFKSFEDKWDPLRIPTKYGLYKGDAFLNWMKTQIKGKGLDENATFADFKDAGCRDLRVFATDLNLQAAREFSTRKTPGVVVAEACRASMSIPLFFQAWKFTNNNPDDHVYVDGGTVYNFPITTFDTEEEPNEQTLGFFLQNLTGEKQANDLDYGHLLKYTKYLFETLLNTQVIDFLRDPSEIDRTVIVNDFGISATDFGLTKEQIEQLYNSGLEYTGKWLKSQVPA